ncbi:MAG: LacI family DNA-binding transcriptional regulator [Aliishimia sp.]
MRPKVKIVDVVRASGVSRATVDRVLNNRSGVKEATRTQVMQALQSLGYAPDALSALLKKRPHDIRIFLLDGTNPFFAEIRNGFKHAIEAIETLGVNASCIDFDPYTPKTLERALMAPDDMTSAIIAVGAETAATAKAIDALQARGIPVITVISDIASSKRTKHIGQDNYAAGETAGRLMAKMVPIGLGSIGLLIGHSDFEHLNERQTGFTKTLRRMRPDLKLITTEPYGGTDTGCMQLVDDLFTNSSDLKGVYLSGGGQPHLIEALSRNRTAHQTIIAHEISQLSRAALEQGTFQALVAHDIAHVARMAIDAAIESTDKPQETSRNTCQKPCGINIYVPENLPKT